MQNRVRWWMWLAIIVAVAIYAAPIVLMLDASLKPREQLVRNPYGLAPGSWSLNNYSQAMNQFPLMRSLANSLWLCLGCVVGATLSSAMAAYALARVRWRGRRLAMSLVVVTMLLPWYVALIPRFWLTREIGLYDSFWAIIAPSFLGNAFFIFLLRQFFLTLPEELFEAARLDGLGHAGLFWRICLPNSRPALLTVALFQFIDTWNDFSGPLVYLSDPDKFPLAYALERFVSAYSDSTHLLLAAAAVFTLVPVLLFICAQRVFIRGIATTGIKG